MTISKAMETWILFICSSGCELEMGFNNRAEKWTKKASCHERHISGQESIEPMVRVQGERLLRVVIGMPVSA
jgi:hypothetical protein